MSWPCEFEKCREPKCSKMVNNKQVRCKDHRMKKCGRLTCKKMISAHKKYCTDHVTGAEPPLEYYETL